MLRITWDFYIHTTSGYYKNHIKGYDFLAHWKIIDCSGKSIKYFFYKIRLFSNERLNGKLLCGFFKSLMLCEYFIPNNSLPYALSLEKNRFI